jgi:hypothetical protein
MSRCCGRSLDSSSVDAAAWSDVSVKLSSRKTPGQGESCKGHGKAVGLCELVKSIVDAEAEAKRRTLNEVEKIVYFKRTRFGQESHPWMVLLSVSTENSLTRVCDILVFDYCRALQHGWVRVGGQRAGKLVYHTIGKLAAKRTRPAGGRPNGTTAAGWCR